MKALEEAGDIFSAYHVDREQKKISHVGTGQEEQSGDSQRLEEYEVVLGNMRFAQMFEELTFGLLNGLMAPKKESKDRAP